MSFSPAAALALLVTLFVAPACDQGMSLPGGVGQTCNVQSDCGGLTCLDYGVPSEAGCKDYGKLCVQTCKSASDCASLGSGYTCAPTCGATSVCTPH